MHDYIFFSGQIIFNEFDQLELVIKMNARFQPSLVFRGQVGDRVGKYPDGIYLSVFPEGNISLLHTQQESENQKVGHDMLCFYIYHLFGNSISVNLYFINKIGLSFFFGVCYNHTRSVMPYGRMSIIIFYHTDRPGRCHGGLS